MKITVLGIMDLLTKCPVPEYNSPFVESVDGKDVDRKPGQFNKPFWTGWKSDLSSIPAEARSVDDEIDIPDGPMGFVGQWITIISPQKFISVNLPNMDAGIRLSGEHCKLGELRVHADTSVDELERLIKEGYGKLMELVAQEKSKVA
jgi:hypothetical protein